MLEHHDLETDHAEDDPDHWWSYCSCGEIPLLNGEPMYKEKN